MKLALPVLTAIALVTVASAQRVSPVTALAMSQDGKRVAAGYSDGSVRMIETGSRLANWKCPGPTSPLTVSQLSLSPVGDFVAASYPVQGFWQPVRLIGAKDGKLSRTLLAGTSATFSANGTTIYIATSSGIAMVDTKSGVNAGYVPNTSSVTSIAVSPDGLKLATYSAGTVRVFKIDGWAVLQTYQLPNYFQCSVAFASDNILCASSAEGGALHRWDMLTGNPLPELKTSLGGVMTAVFSPDGRNLAFLSNQNEVETISVLSGTKQPKFKVNQGFVGAISMSAGQVVLGMLSGEVRFTSNSGMVVSKPAKPRRKPDPSTLPTSLVATTVNGVPCKVVKVNLNDPRVRVSVEVANGFPFGDQSFASLVNESGADVAVVGTFFDTVSLRPVGDIVVNGNVIYQGHMGTALTLTPTNETGMKRVPWGRTQDWSGFETVLSCGPALVLNGQIDVDPVGEGFRDPSIMGAVPRVGVGITADNQLMIVAGGSGQTFYGFAKLMKALGCENAMNLDAGSSRALYYRGQYLIKPARRLTNILTVHID
ncbi:MAG: phosphodiester glycosidase family protein [Armatimonadetes bacterium]|nr:phosphodiester glycosidase family protein [Armatimonadota bacterium]